MRFLKAFSYHWNNFGFLPAVKLVAVPRIAGRICRKDLYIPALLRFQRKLISKTIAKYRAVDIVTEPVKSDYTIWTCWWQGEDFMPEVIRECHKSLKRNANGHKIVLITKHNYQEYITLPDWLIQKADKGNISLSHFSDIIRLALLKKFGGFWLDSALFITRPLSMKQSFFMPKMRNSDTSICQGKWWFGAMAGPANHKIFSFMLDALLEYWSKCDAVINYLMFDGFLRIAYEEYNDVRTLIDTLDISSPDLHSSRYTFDKGVDYNRLNSLLNDNDFLSLTWRLNYPMKLDSGEMTYYGALITQHRN